MTMQFSESIISSSNQRKGNYRRAEDLIRENKLTNEEISIDSGVSSARIANIRWKIRRVQNRN